MNTMTASGLANADQNAFHGPQPQKHKPELLRNGLKLASKFYLSQPLNFSFHGQIHFTVNVALVSQELID